jgi:hypothetical protein
LPIIFASRPNSLENKSKSSQGEQWKGFMKFFDSINSWAGRRIHPDG